MRAFRFVGAYKRAAAHSRARGKTASMPALVCVYLIASDAHEPRALTPFLSQVFLTWCRDLTNYVTFGNLLSETTEIRTSNILVLPPPPAPSSSLPAPSADPPPRAPRACPPPRALPTHRD